MNRAGLIKKVASHLNLNEIEVADFIGSLFDTMAAVLGKGRNINIPEFGKFIVRENFSEGVTVRNISFSPSKKFADEINKNFSDLSPVLTKALNIHDLKEIIVTEADAFSGENDFVSFVFEDAETEIQFEAPESDTLTPMYREDFVPVPFDIPQTETADVPYLIPLFRSPSPIPDAEPYPVLQSGQRVSTQEEETQQDQDKKVFELLEKISHGLPETAPVTLTGEDDIILIPETAGEENVTPDSEPAAESETDDTSETSVLHEEIPPVPETAGESGEETKEKNRAEIIEEKIISEKEIILRDIEEYIKSKEIKTDTPEEETKDEQENDDNYFVKANVFSEFDIENNFAVEDIKESDLRPQNVFEDENLNAVDSRMETERQPEVEFEQNVFSDLEDFFRSENGSHAEITDIEKTGSAETAEQTEDEIIITDNAGLKSAAADAKQDFLKDNIEEQDLNEEILSLLMSREKAINDLSKYGLDIASDETEPEEGKKETRESETDILPVISETRQPDDEFPGVTGETIFETGPENVPGSTPVINEIPGQNVFEEDKDSIYDELNKRIAELEELTAKKESLEIELKQKVVSPELSVFEKLVEEKPPAAPEKPVGYIPEIIIHDPGNKYEDQAPKSLTDALEEVNLDGIIEHLEHSPTIIEEKSYDDVFKPADIPFVPISNQEPVFKKQNKLLKFLLYFFFVVIFSMMSFFLYKSVLTPNRKTPVDTLGTKINDSVASKINLIDTEFNKGTINLNEFEVEREGDIVYKQTDNGYIIQIAKFDKYSEALKYVSGLDNKNIHAEVERVDLPMNVTEYRIIVGTFETLQEAKSYFKNSSMLLNFIKVMTPFKTTLSF